MLYKSGGSPTPFSAELNRKPFPESIIWAFTQVSLHGSIMLSGKGRLAGRFNALWNAEVLKEPSSMWKSKHLAHHHGRFLVERASSISLKAPRRSLPPPASHPPKGLQAILQELTQMSAATRTDAAAADRWCFTAGFLSGVMRGSDHGQAKGYVHHRKNFHCTISHSKDSFMLITTSLQFAPKFWRAAVPQRSCWEDHARLHPDGQGKTRVLFEVQGYFSRIWCPVWNHMLLCWHQEPLVTIKSEMPLLIHSLIHATSQVPDTIFNTVPWSSHLGDRDSFTAGPWGQGKNGDNTNFTFWQRVLWRNRQQYSVAWGDSNPVCVWQSQTFVPYSQSLISGILCKACFYVLCLP